MVTIIKEHRQNATREVMVNLGVIQEVKIEHNLGNLGGWLRLKSGVGNKGHLRYGGAEGRRWEGAGLGSGKVEGLVL